MDSPVSAGSGGVKLRPELMERESLYHCIFRDKAILVFKDHQDVLHCYEVEEAALVERIRGCGSHGELEAVFGEYLRGGGQAG